MTLVLFSLLDEAKAKPQDRDYLSFVKQESADSGLRLAASPEEAEVIVLLENAEFKFSPYLKELERNSLLARFPEKVFTLNYEDVPNGALAGLYSSLRPEQYCAEIHRSWPHVCLPNEKIHNRAVTEVDSASLLFSFRGNLGSHPLRAKLGRLYGGKGQSWRMEEIDRWYNHSGDEKNGYLAHIEEAVFALCPRGIASYTHRIGEVMALGRVPVILSDEWIPFCFEETEPYFIRIAEADVARIPDILRERRGEARALAANARRLFERYLAIGKRFPEAIRAMMKIQTERPSDWRETFYTRRWPSRKFWQVTGWTLKQRVMRKVRKLISG